MAYIKVNHRKIISAADKIDNYLSKFDKNMTGIDIAVTSLNVEWKGADYQQVKTEWDEINSSDSTSYNMRTSLNNYASAVREAAKKYQEAQARAINRANSLCN